MLSVLVAPTEQTPAASGDLRITRTASRVDSGPDQALQLHDRPLWGSIATPDDSTSLHEWLHALPEATGSGWAGVVIAGGYAVTAYPRVSSGRRGDRARVGSDSSPGA